MKQLKILNFGSCNIDFVYTVDHIVNPGETVSAEKLELFPGGKGLNQSIAMARAGASVCHAGYIGTDGEMLRQILQESGADVSFLKQVDNKNGHAIIQVDSQGENSIFVYKGTNGCIEKSYMDQVLENFSQGDFLVLQNEINDIFYLIDRAHEKGMQIVFNPSPFTAELKKLDLSKISYLILNETEAKNLSGDRDFADFIRQNYKDLKVVLTLGKQGCTYMDAQMDIFHPAYQVKTVDTTAAGDTFTGYFIAQIAKGKSCREAIAMASAASAMAVSKMGAAPSIPYREEVKQAMKSLKPYSAEESKTERQRRQILQYVQSNLDRADLNGLAQRLGYSSLYVGERVREVMGISFGKLVGAMRCEAAAALLRETDLPISEIIHKIGYENESFFRKRFKELYGKTPFAYRKNKEMKK